MFYKQRHNTIQKKKVDVKTKSEESIIKDNAGLYQCTNCLSVYSELLSETESNISPGTTFDDLPEDYCCPLCEAAKDKFKKIDHAELLTL